MTKNDILNKASEHKNYFDKLDLSDVHEAMDEYAKQEAIAFIDFRDTYRRVEGINFNHACAEIGGMFSYQGADDNGIWEAYKKGEQLKRYYEK